ncbi:unnamed protein product [Dicrocoelium dendriticum]|nr:unnamed protein product [Dicrocoelium dendriticum]
MFQSVSETCASHMYQTAASSPMRPVKTPRLFRRCHSGGDLCASRPTFEVEQLAEMLKAVTSNSSTSDYCTRLNILSPTEATLEDVNEYDLMYVSSNSSMSNGSDEESSASSLKKGNLLGSTNSSRVRVPFKPMRTKTIQAPSTEPKLEHRHARESKLVIIDCRYPYEYYGGHIQGAINMAEWPILRRFLFGSHGRCCANKLAPKLPRSSRTVFVMHCEFSSQRAPKLFNLLRNHDRLIHMSFYPALRYPKIFLLRGGYAAFFRSHPELCEPSAYVKMHSFPELLSSWSRHCEIVNRRNSVCCDCWPGVVRLPLFPLPIQ